MLLSLLYILTVLLHWMTWNSSTIQKSRWWHWSPTHTAMSRGSHQWGWGKQLPFSIISRKSLRWLWAVSIGHAKRQLSYHNLGPEEAQWLTFSSEGLRIFPSDTWHKSVWHRKTTQQPRLLSICRFISLCFCLFSPAVLCRALKLCKGRTDSNLHQQNWIMPLYWKNEKIKTWQPE